MDPINKNDQRLTVIGKNALKLNGVLSVLGFDESFVSLDTTLGRIVIEGANMRIESLSKESAEIYVVGDISGVYYTEAKEKGRRLGRIFK